MNFLKKDNSTDHSERKKEIKKTSKESNRTIDRNKRDIERELRELDRQEKTVTAKLKQANTKGRQSEVKSYAKEIIQIRKTRERLQQASGRLSSVKAQTTTMASTAVVMETMGVASTAMKQVNAAMGTPAQINQTMNEFMREQEKMNMVEDSWGDLIDSFDGEEVENETNELVDKVLEEAGLEVTSGMSNAPTHVPLRQQQANSEREKEEQELNAFLATLS